MDDSFVTVSGVSEAEISIKGSRFIAVVMPCSSEEEIKPLIEGVKRRYTDARHYCYASITGGPRRNIRSSDDGEPSGTAGKPISAVLKGAELSDVLCVVVRYFGGTLLGTGGLVHAYTESSSMAVSSATTIVKTRCSVFSFTLDYSMHSSFASSFRDILVYQPKCEYGAAVDVRCLVPCSRAEEFSQRLSDFTDRRIQVSPIGEEYV